MYVVLYIKYDRALLNIIFETPSPPPPPSTNTIILHSPLPPLPISIYHIISPLLYINLKTAQIIVNFNGYSLYPVYIYVY